jgi:hypothetical protein
MSALIFELISKRSHACNGKNDTGCHHFRKTRCPLLDDKKALPLALYPSFSAGAGTSSFTKSIDKFIAFLKA